MGVGRDPDFEKDHLRTFFVTGANSTEQKDVSCDKGEASVVSPFQKGEASHRVISMSCHPHDACIDSSVGRAQG